MQLPVDNTTLAAWSTLLGLTATQAAEILAEVEADLRRGYTFRPLAVRHLSFEELTADMDTDELALMFLVTGLKQAGHEAAADDVFSRSLTTQSTATPAD